MPVPNTADSRHALIDLYLNYWGEVRREDLSRHLGVSSVTASRIFKEYFTESPGNESYSVSRRRYVWTDSYEPAHAIQPEKALELLAYGSVSGQVNTNTFGPSYTTFGPVHHPEFVGAVTRAMVGGYGVGIQYVSGSSGATYKTLFPYSVFKSGTGWYFRALDLEKDEYRTYRFNRITGIEDMKVEIESGNLAGAEYDHEWLETVILTLAPHTKYPNPPALAIDLGLEGLPVKNIQANAATAGFVLTDLRVDCSAKARLSPYEYPLQLMNRSELTHVSSMKIAPGFTDKK